MTNIPNSGIAENRPTASTAMGMLRKAPATSPVHI
ncbi:hypothetical protein F442_13081 [Phytophthora nicotianae P10297]|uniref:Uncharacterized protein n=3 Tax=Phytophthora nicotianae TaxID=4792 RepID=W2R6P2_PHYN3|nr:hypothetical protein PPTG_21247 [Phytophthora nicotianae INRA-310]ETN20190.1 hypothetical protein PPTG_21247 [Phytophthora nicotianae INRA-310]ETO70214.1 hypothetical protein F444_13285 [Phytophthora nicotianae P1976]ETP39454.1 hypothetical protein F442_13081 [Phytophthora nicotianae P10297]